MGALRPGCPVGEHRVQSPHMTPGVKYSQKINSHNSTGMTGVSLAKIELELESKRIIESKIGLGNNLQNPKSMVGPYVS